MTFRKSAEKWRSKAYKARFRRLESRGQFFVGARLERNGGGWIGIALRLSSPLEQLFDSQVFRKIKKENAPDCGSRAFGQIGDDEGAPTRD